MNQSIRGRATREADGKPPVVFNSYDGAAGTKAVPCTHRLCRSNNSTASAMEEWMNWNTTRRTHQERCMYKADASPGSPRDPTSRPQKEARPTLPLISKGATQAAATKPRSINKNTDVSHPGKTQKRGNHKSQPTTSGDMTPWVNASPSESSLTALMGTIPSPRIYFDDMADQRHGQKAPKDKATPEQQLPKDKTQGRAKQRGRAGVTKRRTTNKFHSIKLPPVPAVTELSFSRNFSFSFFELPEHQSPQHWLQRQRAVHVLMRQLQ